MTDETADNELETADEAALNEEASRELAALVAAEETPDAEAESADESSTYVVQNAAERMAIIEALIFVSEEPLSAKVIASVLREDREAGEPALAELAKEFNARNGGLQLREVAGGGEISSRPQKPQHKR